MSNILIEKKRGLEELPYEVVVLIMEYIPYFIVGKYGGLCDQVNEHIKRRGKKLRREIKLFKAYHTDLYSITMGSKLRFIGRPKIENIRLCVACKNFTFSGNCEKCKTPEPVKTFNYENIMTEMKQLMDLLEYRKKTFKMRIH